MANVTYRRAKRDILKGDIDFDVDDIRAILVMTNTTVDTEETVTTISGFTTLDEMDGSGYARVALTGEAVSEDAINNRAEFDATDTVFSSLGVGTRDIEGALLYLHVTNDSDSIPLVFLDFAPDVSANGGDITITYNSEGIIQLT